MNGITFSATGSVLTQTLSPDSNSIAQTFTYNDRLQLTRIQAASGATTLMDFTYDYGTSSTSTGRVLSRADAIQPEHSASYLYDSTYRLAQVYGGKHGSTISNSWAISWTFDVWGNRLAQTPAGLATSKVGSSSFSYSGNRITGVSNLAYDSAGNLTNEGATGSHSYSYNANNRQTQMDGGAATYGYDGEGRRMKRRLSSAL
jgi:hypothetical protein